jgi:hypothetical protein
MIPTAVVLAGVATGGGAALIVAGLLPTTPDLQSALARLSSSTTSLVRAEVGTGGQSARDGRWRRSLREHLPRLASALGLDRHRADLDLIGEAPERLAFRKVGFGLLGLAFTPVLATAMALIGLSLPWAIPGFASVVLAALLFLAPDLDVRRRAVATRAEMRRAVCIYLELVALERVADAGTTEALHRAAEIGDGRAFALIRDALLRAQLTGTAPWQGLARLAAELRVPELGDVADIMRLSGEDGAAVYATLRARAASLRSALLTDAAAEANAASEHMIMPVAVLGVAFMALLGYPAFSRILFG